MTGVSDPELMPQVTLRAKEALRGLMAGDNPPEVRREAALGLALVGKGDGEIIGALVEALEQEQDIVRRAAAVALGKTGERAAVEPLLTALERSPELWQEVSAALVALRDPGSIDRLRRLAGEAGSTKTRRGAVRALAGLADADRARSGAEEGLRGYEDERGVPHPLL